MTFETGAGQSHEENPTLGPAGQTNSNAALGKARSRILLICFAAWTFFVAGALWWLFQGNPHASLWIFHQGDAFQQPVTEHVRAFFKADMGFDRIYPWILLGPYVALVASLFPLEQNYLRRNLLLNLAVCVAFVVACNLIELRTRITVANVTFVRSESGQGLPEAQKLELHLSDKSVLPAIPEGAGPGQSNALLRLNHALTPPPPLPSSLNRSAWPVLLDLLAYGAIAGLAHAVHYYRRFREREHRALFLESSLTHARLNALRAQLHPHFLFNSLNAIATLLRRDPRVAEATLISLSELLRATLNQSERQELTLREEMELIDRYLEIQQTRFGERMRVEREIDPAALDCLVPTLLLQPLVENAIQHGLESVDHSGLLLLRVQRSGENLVLAVEDNGAGPAGPRNGHAGTGIGLANLRARLEALYGTRQKLELLPRERGGALARVEIPWRPSVFEKAAASDPRA